MPKNVAQWTGLAVTAIVVLGCDMDVLYAVPLGVFAGALATFFVSLSGCASAADYFSGGILLIASSSSAKLGCASLGTLPRPISTEICAALPCRCATRISRMTW